MTRIAINGFGRIGRTTFRRLLEKSNLEVVAINDLTSPEQLVQLMKFDSVYGRFPGDIKWNGSEIEVNGKKIVLTSIRNPEELPWSDLKVDVVLDCTGIFKTYDKAAGHLKAGASKVLLSYPVGDAAIRSVVLGVNDDELQADDKIISNASCTTNCTAPVAKVLDDNWGIKRGFLSTIHAYTADQRINDSAHSDPRRARAAGINIVPTSTGAASALGIILPALKGKIEGSAFRVPVVTGSVIELTVELDKAWTVEEVNAAMKAAADGPMKGVLCYSTDPLVSTDIVADPHSSVFDSELTSNSDGLLKIVSWYDNEYGYSSRLADLAERVSK